MQNQPEPKLDIQSLHQQWLTHPITHAALELLVKLKDAHVTNLSSKINDLDVTDAAFRGIAVNIRNTDAILSMLSDSEIFARKYLELNPPNTQTQTKDK